MNQALKPNSTGSQYTDEQRREAMSHYALLGNAQKVSDLTSIPRRTINDWTKTEWGVGLLASIRLEKSDEIDAIISNTLEKSSQALLDRIDNGDDVITSNGEHDRQLMRGRDLATVFGIMFDKRQIIRNLPTSIKAESTDTRLNSLADKVRELQAGQNKVISGDAEEVKD